MKKLIIGVVFLLSLVVLPSTASAQSVFSRLFDWLVPPSKTTSPLSPSSSVATITVTASGSTTGDTSSAYYIPAGATRSFSVSVDNISNQDFFVGKSSDFRYTVSPSSSSGDTSTSYIVPAGTKRSFQFENITFDKDLYVSKSNFSIRSVNIGDGQTLINITSTIPAVSSGDTKDSYILPAGTSRQFAITNNGDRDFYLNKNPNLIYKASSPETSSRDTSKSYIVPVGTSRTIRIDNTASINKDYYLSKTDLFIQSVDIGGGISITADPIDRTGDTSTAYYIPGGTKRSFKIDNQTQNDFKVDTLAPLVYTASPAQIAGDTVSSLVIPSGTVRILYITTSGTAGHFISRTNLSIVDINSTATNITITPIPCYTFTNFLTFGSSGPDVEALQKFLIGAGFYGFPEEDIRGTYGEQTKAAVGRYQSSTGLPNTGFVGPLTVAKLNSSCAGRVTTDTTTSSITISSPKEGEVWKVGSSYDIQWTGAKNGAYTIYLSGGGHEEGYKKKIGSAYVQQGPNSPTFMKYTVGASDLPTAPGYTWAILICPTDQITSSNQCSVSKTFTITSGSTLDVPTISRVSSKANPDYQFYPGDDVTLTGAYIASNGIVKIGNTDIQLYGDSIPDNSLTFRVPATVKPGTYSLYVFGPALTTNKVQVTVLAKPSTSPAPVVSAPRITAVAGKAAGNWEIDANSDTAIQGTNLVGNSAVTTHVYVGGKEAVIKQADNNLIYAIMPKDLIVGRVYDLYISNDKGTSNTVQVKVLSLVTSSIPVPSTSPVPVANPSITVKSPNGGEQYTTLESRTITWSTSNLPSTATISLQLSYRNKGASSNVEDVIVSGIQNTGSYLWTIPSGYGVGKEPNLFWMRVIAGVGEKVEDYSNSTFTIAQTVTPAQSTAPVQSSAPVSAGTPSLSASTPTITGSATGVSNQLYAGNMTISSTISNVGNAPSSQSQTGYFQYSTDGSYFSDWVSVSIPAINSGSSYNTSYSWTGGNGNYYFRLKLPDGKTSGSTNVNIISQPVSSPSSSASPSGSGVSQSGGNRSLIASVFYSVGDYLDSIFSN